MAEGIETIARPAPALAPPTIVPRWLWALGLIAAVLMTAQSFSLACLASGWTGPTGVTGLRRLDDCDAARFCSVSDVQPGSPAALAGMAAGDRVRLDRYWERRRTLYPGDARGVTIRRAGAADTHADLIAVRAPPMVAPTFIIGGVASGAVCLIALLILARAGRRWTNFLFGCSLVSVGVPSGYPRFWQNDPALYPWFFAGLAVCYMAGPVLMLAALRGFRRDVIGHSPRWLDRLVWIAAIGALIATVWGTAADFNSAPLLGVSRDLLLTSLTWSAGSLLGPLALAVGWHEVPAASRTRYAFMWIAVSVISIHPIVDPIIIATGNVYATASWPVVVQLVSQTAGAALFAYAILRHRVIDVGFAINRTLVYSALSFLTLAIFGLVEWASEKLLPIKSHEANVAIEAGVALILFLVFHHIHAWIETAVERLFFHRWHANEKAMRSFLHRASYVTRADVLIERAVAELKRFGGGAAVAFYRAAPGGFVFVAGDAGAPAWVDADTPAMLAMRADHIPLHDAFAGGDLTLPMTHRAEVTGFVTLGAKPGGDPYRPDESALLAEAVSRIGLDLYAFRVEELEALNARLTLRLEALEPRPRDVTPVTG